MAATKCECWTCGASVDCRTCCVSAKCWTCCASADCRTCGVSADCWTCCVSADCWTCGASADCRTCCASADRWTCGGPEEVLASSADGCRGVENFHHQSRMTVQTTLRNCADSHEAVLTNVLCFRMIAYAQACKRLAFITGRLLPVLSPPVQSSAPRPVAGPSRAGRDVDQLSESADSAGPFVLRNPAEVASALEIGSSRFPSLYGCRPRSLQLDECQQRP